MKSFRSIVSAAGLLSAVLVSGCAPSRHEPRNLKLVQITRPNRTPDYLYVREESPTPVNGQALAHVRQ